ncbi:F-box/FBD/LRR-repeat protein At3g52680 [Linum grandiflorum]
MVNKKSIDRLSNLPDSSLDHILSFLDTKSAVQTSVLSRQWKCTWKQVSVLRFDSRYFLSYASFESYVNKVLSLRSPLKLHEVILIDHTSTNLRDNSLFLKVIEYAFVHHTQHLTIYLYNYRAAQGDAKYSFSSLFGSAVSHLSNLKSLKMGFLIIPIGSRYLDFQMLKKLKLSMPVFKSQNDQVFDFFSEFPCLEDLTLDGEHFIDRNDQPTFKISGPQLRTLNISNNQFVIVAINAPNLRSLTLHYEGDFAHFPELVLPSLDHADIWIDNRHCPAEKYIDYADNIITFFAALGNVSSFTLRTSTLKTLGSICEVLVKTPSPFKKLQTLVLPRDRARTPMDAFSQVIHYFIRSSKLHKRISW